MYRSLVWSLAYYVAMGLPRHSSIYATVRDVVTGNRMDYPWGGEFADDHWGLIRQFLRGPC